MTRDKTGRPKGEVTVGNEFEVLDDIRKELTCIRKSMHAARTIALGVTIAVASSLATWAAINYFPVVAINIQQLIFTVTS